MNIEVISQGVNYVQYKGAFHLIFRVSVDMYGQDRGKGAMRASTPMIYLLLTDGYKEG